MRATLARHLEAQSLPIERLNVSTYGASLVHLDMAGEPVCPLYNYLKPLPEDVSDAFYSSYGPPQRLARETASPVLGMLNAGLQLYWLKQARPEVFRRIAVTMHLPQYLASLFSGVRAQEYTSLGCHTALWDFARSGFHRWVHAEDLVRLFPPIGSTYRTFASRVEAMPLRVGVGVHDSSAALLPYLRYASDPFLLLSTGTWSIAFNPFSAGGLSADALRQDALLYLRPDGKPVKASRLFLGREHDIQVERLAERYPWDAADFGSMAFDREVLARLLSTEARLFAWDQLEAPCPTTTSLPATFGPREAYHQLLLELCRLQVEKLRLITDGGGPRKVFVDGGFAGNQVFLRTLAHLLPGWQLLAVRARQGTGLGAALCARSEPLPEQWLERHYRFDPVGPE